MHLFLLHEEVLRVVHGVILRVLHPQPPWLRGRAVDPVVPLEVGSDAETNAKDRACDWLNGCR